MQILQAIIRLFAVLGIASLVVLLSAAILYALQRAGLSDADEISHHATIESAVNSTGSKATGSTPHLAEFRSETVEPGIAKSVSETSVSTIASSGSSHEPAVSAPVSVDKSPSTGEQDAAPAADREPSVTAASMPAPTQDSPRAVSTSSGAASDNSLQDQSVARASAIRHYTVESGDTLYGIARRVYGEGRYWQAIYDANRDLIADSRQLKLGWRLELPPLEKVVAED